MDNILIDLYHGNISPSEGTYPKGEEYQKAAKQVCSIESALLEKQDYIGKELYQQLTLAIIARNSIEDAIAFSDAFKLGAKIMLAILQEED